MITITNVAKHKLKNLIVNNSGKSAYLYLKSGGCNGFNHTFDILNKDEKPHKYDEIVNINDLRNSKKNLVDYARQKEIPTIVYDDVFEDGLFPNLLINPTESCKNKYVEQEFHYMLGKKHIILDPRQSKYSKDIFSQNVDI